MQSLEDEGPGPENAGPENDGQKLLQNTGPENDDLDISKLANKATVK